MGITIGWDNLERTILRIIYEDGWTKEDQIAINNEGKGLLDSAACNVNMIFDLRGLTSVPCNLYSIIPEVVHSAFFTHPNSDRVVIVGANRLLQALSAIVPQVYTRTRGKFMHASSLEEAYQALSGPLKTEP